MVWRDWDCCWPATVWLRIRTSFYREPATSGSPFSPFSPSLSSSSRMDRFGTSHFVIYIEVVVFSEVRIY